tara:strand:- start:216 stop:566 length:351 start_codon:yes stop_codon:yes gene_type:complete
MDDENYFIKMLARVVEHGIHLGDIDDTEKYLENLVDTFATETHLFCRYENKVVIVEDSMCNPIMNLAVNKDTLFVVPAGEDNFFSCFLKVIKYVSDVHRKKKNKKKEIDEETFEWI